MEEGTHPYGLCKGCYYNLEVVKQFRDAAKEQARLEAPAGPDGAKGTNCPGPGRQGTYAGAQGFGRPADADPPITPGDFVGQGQSMFRSAAIDSVTRKFEDMSDEDKRQLLLNGWVDYADRNPTDKPIRIDNSVELDRSVDTDLPVLWIDDPDKYVNHYMGLPLCEQYEAQKLFERHPNTHLKHFRAKLRALHDAAVIRRFENTIALDYVPSFRPVKALDAAAFFKSLEEAGVNIAPFSSKQSQSLEQMHQELTQANTTFLRCTGCNLEVSSWQAQKFKEFAFKQLHGLYYMDCPQCRKHCKIELLVPEASNREV